MTMTRQQMQATCISVVGWSAFEAAVTRDTLAAAVGLAFGGVAAAVMAALLFRQRRLTREPSTHA